jgi:hypothetical protein
MGDDGVGTGKLLGDALSEGVSTNGRWACHAGSFDQRQGGCFCAWVVDDRDADDHDDDADGGGEAGERSLGGVDENGDDGDEERPGVDAGGWPAGQRGVEADVDEHLAADDQVGELRDQGRVAPGGGAAVEEGERDEWDAPARNWAAVGPGMSRSGSLGEHTHPQPAAGPAKRAEQREHESNRQLAAEGDVARVGEDDEQHPAETNHKPDRP